MHPEVKLFLARLRTVPEYAAAQGISLVQAHRRISSGKAVGVSLRGKAFVLLASEVAASSPPKP